MGRLSDEDLASRREYDWRIVSRMSGQAGCTFTAHRTAQDAEHGRQPVESQSDARRALHYRAEYRIRTLIGPGEYSSLTIARIDASDRNYPFAAPSAWIVETAESHTPWSPHFRKGVPFCSGSVWRPDGTTLLAHYLIHLARLLNWDEVLRNGYGGYNSDAVDWWRKHYSRPLNPEQRYPPLPADLLYGEVVVQKTAGGFRPMPSPTTVQVSGGFRRA
jgi:hypothetical protein